MKSKDWNRKQFSERTVRVGLHESRVKESKNQERKGSRRQGFDSVRCVPLTLVKINSESSLLRVVARKYLRAGWALVRSIVALDREETRTTSNPGRVTRARAPANEPFPRCKEDERKR